MRVSLVAARPDAPASAGSSRRCHMPPPSKGHAAVAREATEEPLGLPTSLARCSESPLPPQSTRHRYRWSHHLDVTNQICLTPRNPFRGVEQHTEHRCARPFLRCTASSRPCDRPRHLEPLFRPTRTEERSRSDRSADPATPLDPFGSVALTPRGKPSAQ
jgi:hypothetical protein